MKKYQKAIIEDIKFLIPKIYEYNSVGSNCHVVIDDDNVDNEAIEHCLGFVEQNLHKSTPEQQEIERRVLRYLLLIPEKLREQVIIDAKLKC